jgi:hypothetical protein
MVGGSAAEAEHYLTDRAGKGFSAIIVNLIERCFAPDPPRTTDGIEPFAEPGDFRTVRDEYLGRAADIIGRAERHGLLVLLCPAYLGYVDPRYPGYEGQPEGWFERIVAQPPESLRAYGRRIADALAPLGNIVWVLAGDRQPGEATAHMEAMAEGIREADPGAIFTGHVHPGRRPLESFPWLQLNQVYSYGIVHRRVHDEYRLDPPRPFILFESTYEHEGESTPLMLRQQSWWAMLGGACGQVFGNKPVWGAFPGWLDALDSPATADQIRLASFFAARPWWRLVPDLEHRLLAGGLGEHNGLDRAVAAITDDGSLAVAYVPVAREIPIDMRALPEGRYRAHWLDPASGREQPAGDYAAAGRWPLRHPWEEDGVLVLDRLTESAEVPR